MPPPNRRWTPPAVTAANTSEGAAGAHVDQRNALLTERDNGAATGGSCGAAENLSPLLLGHLSVAIEFAHRAHDALQIIFLGLPRISVPGLLARTQLSHVASASRHQAIGRRIGTAIASISDAVGVRFGLFRIGHSRTIVLPVRNVIGIAVLRLLVDWGGGDRERVAETAARGRGERDRDVRRIGILA